MKRPAKAETADAPSAEDDLESATRNLEEEFEEAAVDEKKPKRKQKKAPQEKAQKAAKKSKGENAEGDEKEQEENHEDKKGEAKKVRGKRASKKGAENEEEEEADGKKVEDEEMFSLLKSRTTFAGRYPPSSTDARNRFIAVASIYMSKVEPSINSASFTQARASYKMFH